MNIEDFVKNFSDQFDDTDESAFSATTKFKELEEWSSIVALSIIAMVDEEYDISLKGDDIEQSITIEDLYNIVKSKK